MDRLLLEEDFNDKDELKKIEFRLLGLQKAYSCKPTATVSSFFFQNYKIWWGLWWPTHPSNKIVKNLKIHIFLLVLDSSFTSDLELQGEMSIWL